MANSALKPSLLDRFRLSWNHFKSRLLLKYAFSYILIFLIPLTGVTIFIYENAVKGLRVEIEQANVNQLNQVKSTIDNRMNELQEIAGRIAYDKHLTPYMVQHPYYSLEAIQALANYKASSSIAEDLLLYFHNDSHIYSHRGLANLDVTFASLYQFEHWSLEDLRQDLNETRQPLVRPAENVKVNSRMEPMLVMLVPVKPNDPFPYGTVVYLMKESNLTGVMDSILSDFSGSSYIFSPSGEVLTANSHGISLPQDEIENLATLAPGIHNLKMDGEQYSVVSVQSEENGWTYVTTMPSFQFFSRVAHVQTLILIVFCITVITGIAAALLLAKRQYHPIRDLMDKMRGNGDDASKLHNEWEWIRQTLHNYSAKIDFQEPFVRNQCMLLLLKQGKPDDPEIEQMILNAGFRHPQGQGLYFSAILSWDDTLPGDKCWQERLLLQDILSNVCLPGTGAQIFGVEFSVKDQFALIISLPGDVEKPIQNQLEEVIEAILLVIREHSQLSLSIGVGTAYGDLARLNQSFIEAATALEHRIIQHSGQVTYFEQLAELNPSTSESFWIPRKSMLKLEQSLKQGNESVTVQLITETIHTIKNEPLQVHLLRCICFDLLNAFLRTASELGMNEVFANMSELTAFETLEDLESRLLCLAADICAQVELNTKTSESTLMDDILVYVDQQFADYTLSLEHVALKFAISTSYLSRSFKEKTGRNFSQYIWQRRVDEVMRLLENTSAPLKEIIEQVGYMDAPNFIRKFKKEIGLTPGQYRKEHASRGATIKRPV
ncbi:MULTISPECIES: helix-turn-helix domain-containing protein [unclassified Paenibacillus]|uniref:helix-turn-helix domain-containing protein n=1 Tax=unclassified Paenibacillus TaxID=185978 RepID=UPI000CFC663D|nr:MULTISPECIES: helix-turn-helix domain-containing protein [unclassified Paenibacillus]MBD8836541.1 helix-turn-helix domain-containing protein [Paenibacillus sp. CFBP 13594]PRA04972.1 AraC family transcriptional regulator [Paenibacillus sp. MYb63]PRA47683.1 AraC family transcriptional regulator [Paenibacillus sp. MYb67]QZN74849.1 helix-turn-helix domain-containing protein [Paenibacillus sp. DR312]